MDKTDIILTQLLLRNSRLPYRELAEKLDLSVNAVHKRIRELSFYQPAVLKNVHFGGLFLPFLLPTC